MASFAFCQVEHECLRVEVRGYEQPERSGEFRDDNWLSCEVDVRAGAFAGRFATSFQTMELGSFLGALQQLHKTLRGEAVFEHCEGQLELHLSCDRLGQVRVAGIAADRPGDGHRLSFAFAIDAAGLGRTIGQLEATMQAFPIRG